MAAHCTVKVQKQAPTLEEIIGKEVGSAGLEMFNGIFSAAGGHYLHACYYCCTC